MSLTSTTHLLILGSAEYLVIDAKTSIRTYPLPSWLNHATDTHLHAFVVKQPGDKNFIEKKNSGLAICMIELGSSLRSHQLGPSSLAACIKELECLLRSHPQLGSSDFAVCRIIELGCSLCIIEFKCSLR